MKYEDFVKLADHGISNRHRYKQDKIFDRSPVRVREFLDVIKANRWEGDEAHAVHVALLGVNSWKTMDSLKTDVVKCLQQAARELWPDKRDAVPQITKVDTFTYKPYFLVENPPPQPEYTPQPDETRFARVIAVGKLWATEFSAEFMQGVQSMATELGIELADRRGGRRAFEKTPTGDKQLTALIKQGSFDPRRDSILVCFDSHDELASQFGNQEVGNFHIVTTGYTSCTVRSDDAVLGQLLANQCVADERAWRADVGGILPKRKVIILQVNQGNPTSEYRQRYDNFDDVISASGVFGPIEPLPFIVDPPYYKASREAKKLIVAKLRELGRENVAAIFPRAEAITPEIVKFIARLKGPRPRIYGERLISSDLALLCDESSPLYAVCGVDPYYYGRMAIRLAACRPSPDVANTYILNPVCISKAEAVEKQITATCRIPEFFGDPPQAQDVRFTGKNFAWHDWMRPKRP